ncbi:transcription activator-like protein [Cinnamomum micranthum f. kanehirae]|uniref:Transcription activator-like protein n=1 Tax=Cinnamomum micranthum f. kanehirae TaxID=337451 RepID=A0A3S3P482_9MAGN|nr:transcription activator-like protein [Cinnamomum micranthum f. kanehirae]
MEVEKSKSEFKSNSVSESQSGSIFRMQPVTEGANGGGLYGTEKGSSEDPRKASASHSQSADGPEDPRKASASHSQSADGPEDPEVEPKHKPPPPTGDRDVDITGQSYIQ